jgi:phosphatidylglycerophosphatase A
MNRVALWIAQGFGIGRIPVVPGTFGTVLGFLWLGLLLHTGNIWLFLLGIIAGFAASVWLCDIAENVLQRKDPGSVVLDEITAFPLCYLSWIISFWSFHHQLPHLDAFFTGRTWYATVIVFVLFRVFDIVKPWPIRATQSLTGGWGVTVDDFIAALYVLVLAWVLSLFLPII